MADGDSDGNKKPKGRFISFAIDLDIARRIKAEAMADGLSASSWVRSLIIRTFREQDIAKKGGAGAP